MRVLRKWCTNDLLSLVFFEECQCERMLSIDRFKKSLRVVKSALGYRAAMASRAVLRAHKSDQQYTRTKKKTYFLATGVIKSCVLRYQYLLSVSCDGPSSDGFGLSLGPAYTVVAIENVDIGRTCGVPPPKLSAGNIDRPCADQTEATSHTHPKPCQTGLQW